MAGDDYVRTGFLASKAGTLRDFEYTDAYLTPEQTRLHTGAFRGAVG